MDKNHLWGDQKENKGAILGVKTLLWLKKVMSNKLIRALISLIIFFYWLLNKKARTASQNYIKTIENYAKTHNITLPKLSSYQHFKEFGNALFDKILCWTGEIRLKDVTLHDTNNILLNESITQGRLILGSHLGNIEMCRALANLETEQKIHVLMHTKQTQKFNQLLQQLNPKSRVNIVSITDITPATMIFLKSMLDKGHFVAILADRLPINSISAPQKHVTKYFLDRPTSFPQGPFLLTLLLNVPTFFLVGIRNNEGYEIFLESITIPQPITRESRDEIIQDIASQYLQYLTKYCLKFPLQWFNFYNFWPTMSAKTEEGFHEKK